MINTYKTTITDTLEEGEDEKTYTKIVNEWHNERKGMEWQLIRQIRIVDENNILIDGYNEIIDTRKDIK